MSQNQYFGDGESGKEAYDFGQIITHASSKENLEHMMQPFDSRCLELRFMNHFPNLIYTGLPIKGEEGTSLGVVLIDAFTGNVVKSGSEASAKVEILPVGKTFNKSDTEDWTFDEFKAHIIAGRHGKTPLMLGGDASFNLIEGVGYVGKIYFRHTKHPLPKMELRLGAVIIDCPFGARIRGAITEPFTLKDRRGMNKRHYLLKLTDPVWRLENIGRNGPFHRKLSKANIMTVQHFLAEYTLNPQRLQNILGKSISATKLKAAANHAQTCNHEIRKTFDIFPMANSDVQMSSLLETSHASIQMVSDAQEISETTVPAKIWDVAVDEADNDIFLESEKAYDSFSGNEHQWFLDDSAGTIAGAFREDENLEFLDSFYLPQTTHFVPTDQSHNSVDYDSAVKKNLCILFTLSQWLFKIDRMSASEMNDNQIRSL